MSTDRTARGQVTRVGVIPNRRLITGRPGDHGWKSVALGAALMITGMAVFLNGLDVDRVTFDFDASGMAARWNAAATATNRPALAVPEPTPRLDDSGDLVFGHEWTDTFAVRGRIDAETGMMVELSVVGSREEDGGEIMVDAMDLLLRVTEPELDGAGRLGTLKELGLVGGDPTADLRATRGHTDYVVGAGTDGASIGMSAAPHSSLASD